MLNSLRHHCALAALSLLATSISSIAQEDPSPPQNEVGVFVEIFQLDHTTANRLVSEHSANAADAKELQEALTKLVDAKSARLVETSWVRGKSESRLKNESIREVIYPTEYDPAEIPNNVEPETKKGSSQPKQKRKNRDRQKRPIEKVFPFTSANPTAFETRNVGTIVEVDPTISTDGKSVELNMAIEQTVRLEDEFYTRDDSRETARGIDHIHMPTFYTMRTVTQISSALGTYNLIGIHTPPDLNDERRLVLVRVDLIKAP